MKTKNIFNRLALAMLMPAMLLTTACSSSDDESIINNENTNKNGYPFHVTVNVTRQGDDATRAEYNESTKKLSFSADDQLFVSGYDSSDGGVGYFAGALTWVSGGTFSGTITTQREYTGTADALFKAAQSSYDVSATLLPAHYEDYHYFYIFPNSDYNAVVMPLFSNKAFALTKKIAVEQFSDEYASGYSSGFALSPLNAILNFTIAGLSASTSVDVALTDPENLNITGSVTTDGSGQATFAMGISGGTYNINQLTLAIGDNNITFTNSDKTLAAGKIYNVSRSLALANVTTSDLGKVIGADGKIYPTANDATAAYTTAVAMIAYVGADSNCSNGLAIALENVGNANSWDNSNNNNDGKTAAELCSAWNTSKTVIGGTWRLPSVVDWQYMLVGCGATGPVNKEPSESFYMSYSGMETMLTAVGGAALTSFWTSTPRVSNAWYVNFPGNGNALIRTGTQSGSNGVRACLAF